MADHKHILIDGTWVDPDVTSTNAVVDPAEIHIGNVGDADWVVFAARAATERVLKQACVFSIGRPNRASTSRWRCSSQSTVISMTRSSEWTRPCGCHHAVAMTDLVAVEAP
jgi:hypothetical protein